MILTVMASDGGKQPVRYGLGSTQSGFPFSRPKSAESGLVVVEWKAREADLRVYA